MSRKYLIPSILLLAGCIDTSQLEVGLKTANDVVLVAETCSLAAQKTANDRCLELPTREQAEECIKNVTAANAHIFSLIDEWKRFRCMLENGFDAKCEVTDVR